MDFTCSLVLFLKIVLFVEIEPLESTMELPHVMVAKDFSEEVSERNMLTAADFPGTARWIRTKEISVATVG